MNFKSLKINILINIALILLAGMIVTAFVSTSLFKKEKIRAEAQKTDLMVFHMVSYISTLTGSTGRDLRIAHYLPQFFEKTRMAAIYFLNDGKISAFNRTDPLGESDQKKINTLMFQAIRDNSKKVLFHGTTWGVFWKDNKYCTITYPLFSDRAVSFTIGLDGIYSDLRSSQKVILYSIFMNTIFLCVVGYIRFSKLIISPIRKLTERAKAFNWQNDSLYMLHNTDNEYGILSKSINAMIEKINQDKKRLETSIVELRQANAELKKAQTGMIRAEKMSSIGRLSAGIAHEIGNPIGIVLGYIDLLKQDTVTVSEKQEFLNRAESEIHRVDKIIQQLLDFSRKKEVVFQEHSVHQIVLEMIDMLTIQPGFSDIEFKTAFNAEHDTVFLDRDQLKQVFLNLMLNAADAILLGKPDDGMIRISSRNEGSMIVIRIEDNGAGILNTDMDHIFDPFFTTKAPGTGTGLGLWVSYMIVDHLSGTIRAESSLSNGTVFHISLPLKLPGDSVQ